MSDGATFALYLCGICVFYIIFKVFRLTVPFAVACFWPLTAPILLAVAAIEGVKTNTKKIKKKINGERKGEKRKKDNVIDIDIP